MKKKKDFTKLQCDNFMERSYNVIVDQFNGGDRHGSVGPSKYYGILHEIDVCPTVRYVSTGILLRNLTTDWHYLSNKIPRNQEVILFCNPSSTQILTINGITLDLSRYDRKKVLEILKDQGFVFSDPEEVV